MLIPFPRKYTCLTKKKTRLVPHDIKSLYQFCWSLTVDKAFKKVLKAFPGHESENIFIIIAFSDY